MADNYLEKKMDDYRRMRSASAVGRSMSMRTKPQGLYVNVSSIRVLLLSMNEKWSSSLIDAFRSAGCKVAFLDSDSKRGTALAQSTGSLFYPSKSVDNNSVSDALAYLTAHWGGVDAVIMAASDIVTLPGGVCDYSQIVIANDSEQFSPDILTERCDSTAILLQNDCYDACALGKFCVFLSSESGFGLRGQLIKFS